MTITIFYPDPVSDDVFRPVVSAVRALAKETGAQDTYIVDERFGAEPVTDPHVAAIRAKIAERQRIMDIVQNQIGCAALDADTPDSIPLSWFRELYTRIQQEVSP